MRRMVVVAGLCALGAWACGGGDDKPGSGAASGPAASGTRAAGATDAAGTGSPAAGKTAASVVAGTAVSGVVTSEDQTAIASGSIGGGDAGETPRVISTVPAPPPGTTPVVDSTEIAPPDDLTPGATTGGDPNALQVVIDLDASAAGIQRTRTVSAGDVFRVAIVIRNAPAFDAGSNAGGVGAFNFNLNYDKTKIVAPSIAGGEAFDRNPDLNQPALGSGWSCLPAPEGDLDDEGGISGDGNPATGEAFLSCFSGSGQNGGTLVLATVEFHAAASGTTELSLSNLVVGSTKGATVVECRASDSAACPAATLTVQ